MLLTALNSILMFWRVYVLVAIIAVIAFGCIFLYNKGYNTAADTYKAAAAAEQTREAAINKDALDKATAKATELSTEVDNLNKELSANDIEVFKAQHANDACLGPDGVSRLNSYRHKTGAKPAAKPTKVQHSSQTRWFFKPKSS